MKEDTARIDELAGKLRFSDLTEEEQTELDALLLRQPEARKRFVNHLILENDLHEDASRLFENQKRSVKVRQAWLLPMAIAAALALGFGFLCRCSIAIRTKARKLQGVTETTTI